LIQSESGEGIFCFPNALVYLALIRLGTKISVEELKNWLGDEKSGRNVAKFRLTGDL
jgi:hypothetical protein